MDLKGVNFCVTNFGRNLHMFLDNIEQKLMFRKNCSAFGVSDLEKMAKLFQNMTLKKGKKERNKKRKSIFFSSI